MALHAKWSGGKLIFYDGTTEVAYIDKAANGGFKLPVVAYAAAGAISLYSHIALVTKSDGAAALTLAVPTATTHDGVVIEVVSTTAQAHTVTATTVGFNAGDAASDVGTFGGAIADKFKFVAYQGEWYVLDNTNVTLA